MNETGDFQHLVYNKYALHALMVKLIEFCPQVALRKGVLQLTDNNLLLAPCQFKTYISEITSIKLNYEHILALYHHSIIKRINYYRTIRFF